MTSAYYKNISGAMMVFDVTRYDTFKEVTKWKKQLEMKTALVNDSAVPCVLLANKVSLQQWILMEIDLTKLI
jgi:GTPase SAR1 family protein